MKKLLLAFFELLFAASAFGQAPNITYNSPQVYILDKPITNLAPVNSGGGVPATIYSQVITFAGTGARGAFNSSGDLATFNQPYGITKDSHGNVYVADYGNNQIRKITPTGMVSTFVPAAAGLSAPSGLAMDAADNLYIADANNNQIKKVSPAGIVSVFAGNGTYGSSPGPALLASFKSPSGVAVDAAGNVYVSDFGNLQIRKISGGSVTVLAGSGASGFANGPGNTASFSSPFGIATDAAGNIYVADINNHAIRKVSSSGQVSTLAGTGTAGSADGTGTAASFTRPYGVTVDATGNVYVSDSENSLVRKITQAGVVTTLAGSAGNFGKVDAVGTNALFSFPIGIVTDGNGNLYTTDNSTNVIRKVLLTGYAISPSLPAGLSFDATNGIISGKPTEVSPPQLYTITAYNTSGQSATTITISTRDISIDATLAGLATSGVTLSPVFSPSQFNYVMTVPETTTGISITPTLAIADATFKINGTPEISGNPFAIPINVGGNTTTILVTAKDGITTRTYQLSVIRKRKTVAAPAISYSTPQQYTVGIGIPTLTVKNTGGAVPANAYGAVTTLTAALSDIIAVAVDPSGNVYTTDIVNNRVQKITPAGTISTFATEFKTPYGLGADAFGNIYIGDSGDNKIKMATASGLVTTVSGESGDFSFADGDALADAKYRNPIGVAKDGLGNIFVADQLNHDIRKIGINGEVTTLAGNNQVGAANGTGTGAAFNEPFGLATDQNNNVYVADSKNNLIRKIAQDGRTITFAGSGADGQTNATGTAASFSRPLGVATDVLGNVYVVDAANSLIRKITPAGVVTRLAGNGLYGYVDGIGGLASFSYPTGIAADQDGQLFVADNSKYVRKVQATGYAINPTTLPAGLVFDAKTGTISGKPTVVTAAANFSITAYNLGGSSTATVNIKVNAANADATLQSLILSAGTLTPAFDLNTTTYVTNNTGNASEITLTPTSTQSSAKITVNGTEVVSGTPSASLPLVVGPNVFNILVTGTDGVTTKNYQLTVNRPVPVYATDATLSALGLSTGAFTSAFNTTTTSYSATVAGTVSGLAVTATSNESHAKIAINGATVASGTESGIIPLNYGSNTITATVTAEDGITQKTYTITVVRAASANADLTGITLSDGTLTPAFTALGLSYTAEVPNNISNISLTPYTADATATVKIKGAVVVSGAGSGSIPLAIGANVINVTVTAQDNATIKTYQVTVKRMPSSDANLSSLTLSTGDLSPAFNPATFNYTSSVLNSIASTMVTPGTSGVNQIITVNGVVVASGAASAAIPLAAGDNLIAIKVTAEDGTTTKNYSLVISRAPSGDAGLAGLNLSAGTLNPAFATNSTVYTAAVSNDVTNVLLTPTSSQPDATIVVNGSSVLSGAASTPIALNVGANTVTTTVTAQDGFTKKDYIVTISRAGSADATLANFTLSTGTLTPAFLSSTLVYNTTVSYATTSIAVTPFVNEANARVAINSAAVASGSLSNNITLNAGLTIITAIVTAQDGTTKTYTLNVKRAASSNANLSSLGVSAGVLSPAFIGNKTDYTLVVGNQNNVLTITPIKSDPGASITVNGVTVASGSVSQAIPLTVGGGNLIDIVVTAEDGSTADYTVTVTRPPSSNADLANLSISSGTLNPVFEPNTINYNTSVNNATTSIQFTPLIADAAATITVNGTTVISGAASGNIALNVGANLINTVVTAQDGGTKTYKVTVTRAASADATLANLTLSSGSLTPGFLPQTTSYSANVAYTVGAVSVTPIVSQGNATVKVNGVTVATGSASAVIAINVGANVITTVVTAQDGVTTKTYTLNITRAKSADADLSALTLSTGILSPNFISSTTAYTAIVGNSVTGITLIPTHSDAAAVIKINGNTVSNGSASPVIPLTVGANSISIQVTAADGSTKTYTVSVTRAIAIASTDAGLVSLAISDGTLSPDFAQSTHSYSASVTNLVTSIRVTAASSESHATITVNGTVVVSGTASAAIPLTAGVNTIITRVIAQDGTTVNTYVIDITREPSNNANLADITLSSGTLSPGFTQGTTSYTASVNNSTTTITLTPTAGEASAVITVNGIVVTDGTASGPIALNVGQNSIVTNVTAGNGSTTKAYTVTVTRAPSNDADLAALTLSAGGLNPAFSRSVTVYAVAVSNAVNAVNLSPTANETNAIIKVNGVTITSGSASGDIALNVGANDIIVSVTAQDGITVKNYTITVTRAPSADATLSDIAVSSGTLNPDFSAFTITYRVFVANAIGSITLTPSANQASAGIKINGNIVASGAASGPIALIVGANVINTLVTAQDGSTTMNYRVTVIRAPSSDASLSDLKLSSGALNPAFATGSVVYNASVRNEIKTITFTPLVNQINATVTVNGVSVGSGSASPAIPLNVGNNIITTIVTAQDGTTTKSYITTVARAPSSNAYLTDLAVSSGNFSPTFNRIITGYAMLVKNNITSITLTPVLEDNTASIVINGVTVASGSASAALALSVGNNKITATVTAQDGTTVKAYTITINRALSSDNDLADLLLSNGVLSPGFQSGISDYTTSVGHAVTTIKLTPIVADANASVKVNGVVVTSGSASQALNLSVGQNAIIAVVTAQNGETNTYKVIVNRLPGTDANLLNLTLSTGTLSPQFVPGNSNYAAAVGNAISTIKITPTLEDAAATVKVNGSITESGTPFADINLNVGDNTITTIVTAQDGTTTKSYTIIVTRAKSSDANLASLTASTGNLSPAFTGNNTAYTLTVGSADNSISITAVKRELNATITVNGSAVISDAASQAIPLTIGSGNVIKVVVTAQDGTTKTYTVTVTREKSADASLVNLISTAGQLVPTFSPTVLAYDIAIGNAVVSATLQPTANDAGAVIRVDGLPVASGAVSQALTLAPGRNPFNVKVTAANGTIQTYAVTFVRALSANADLGSLTLTAGDINPAFTSDNTTYHLSVPYTVDRTTVTAITSDANAVLRINGTVVNSGAASGNIAIGAGATVVTISVTSASGITKSYTVTVTREAAPLSSNANLISLRTSVGELNPLFSSGTIAYAITVNGNTRSVNVTGITSSADATIKINDRLVLSGQSSDDITLADGENRILVRVTAADGITTKTYQVMVTKATFATTLPNVFTPNGDGVNDLWILPNIGLYADCTVKIFNRGGQLLFSSVGYGTPWDGTFNGRVLPPDVYYYIIDLKHNQGVRSGAITILK